MQQLTYASRSLLTPDAVSGALFDLVASLRPGQRPEAVSIPVLTDDGHLVTAQLLLHSGAELVSVPAGRKPLVADQDATSAASADATAVIRSRIAAAGIPVERPAIEDDPIPFTYEERYEWA